jgi:hypothetical protein
MPHKVALRITTSRGDVDFYDDEVEAVRFGIIQDLQLHERQSKMPVLYLFGSEYNVVEVQLLEEYSDTKTRMDSVTDLNEQVQIFYRYNYNPGDSIHAIPVIDDDKEIRQYGYRIAGNYLIVRFLKSA